MKRLFFLLALTFLALAAGLPGQAQMPGAPKLVVTCCLGDSIAVIDARTVRLLNTFSVGSNPDTIRTSPDNKLSVVTQPKEGWISFIETNNMRYGNTVKTPYTANACSPVYSPDGGRLYLLDSVNGLLQEIHLPSFKLVRSLKLAGSSPTEMVISRNGAKMFISHPASGQITLVDLAAWTVLKQQRVSTDTAGLALTGDNGRLLVALPGESRVGIFKTTDLRLLNSVPVGQMATKVAISQKGVVAVINSISNDITFFPLNHPAQRFRAAVGVGPTDLIFSPDGTMCYVTNYSTNDISVIDMAKGEQLGRLYVGKGPKSITWVY